MHDARLHAITSTCVYFHASAAPKLLPLDDDGVAACPLRSTDTTGKLEEGTFGINSAQRQCCEISLGDMKPAKVVDVRTFMQARLISATWTVDFVQQKGRRKFELDGGPPPCPLPTTLSFALSSPVASASDDDAEDHDDEYNWC